MWSGDLSKEDCQKINTRVIGYKGLKLPATSEGKQSVITIVLSQGCLLGFIE